MIGLFTLACTPLLYQTSTLWPVLLLFMVLGGFQQAHASSTTWVRMVEQTAWLVANLVVLVMFPRSAVPGHLSLAGLAQMGVLAWVMLASRGNWQMMWVSLGSIFASLPVVAKVLDMEWLFWVDLGLGLAAVGLAPTLHRLSLNDIAPPLAHRSAPHLTWKQGAGTVMLAAILVGILGQLTARDVVFDLGPENLNASGPRAEQDNRIVFAVRIGKGGRQQAFAPTQAQPWYWRGNVLYTLRGDRWTRPATPNGYNANFPYPAHTTWKDPALQFYMVTWAGPMHARVWLDRPVSTDAIDGGDVIAPAPPSTTPPPPPSEPPPPPPPESFTRDGLAREDMADTQPWHPWFYPGVAALNASIQDTGHDPEDLAWALNLTGQRVAHMNQIRLGELENPRTLRAAQALYDRVSSPGKPVAPEVFAQAWLGYLDAHSVYDLERTAQGHTHNVADAFLFGASPAHGTCVDFATSTVLALRQVGIPARYVTGFVGATWDPYLGTWVVSSSQAHAWVEYYQAQTQQWVRLDPTAAIHRVVHAAPPLSATRMWIQSMTNRHLAPLRAEAGADLPHGDWAWVNAVPWPDMGLSLSGQVMAIATIAGGLIGFTLVVARRWRKRAPARRLQRLQQAVDRAQRRLRRWQPDAARRSHEGLQAWAARVVADHPECGDWQDLAKTTQALYYGQQPMPPDLFKRWRQVGRQLRRR